MGHPGIGGNTIGYAAGEGVCNSGGMGTVVGNRSTVVTATHVIKDCATSQNTVWVQVNGNWFAYYLPMGNVAPGPGGGDVVILTLPSDLPGNVIPANMVTNHHVVSGESVVVTYFEPNRNNTGQLTGFTLLSNTTTVAQDWRRTTDNPANGGQVLLTISLPTGSSGGGVFSGGQLIGVNSGADPTLTLMAPLCHTLFGIVC